MKRNIVDEIVKRPSPQGFYVIPVRREALTVLRELKGIDAVEEAGDTILVLIRSRSQARRLATLFHRKGLLVEG